jgi:phytoene dehydrogenase-like protein
VATDKSVVIIGAGISGYSAASKLMENGFDDVIILEAEDRIGGRINTIPFNDGFIDLGAQWVHGQQNNIIYEMTHEHFDFGSTPFDDVPFTFLLSNGTKPNQELINSISKLCFEIDHKIYTSDTFNGSFGDMFIEIYDGIVANGSSPLFRDLDSTMIAVMRESAERNINAYAAIKSWFDLSAKLCSEEELALGNQHNTWRKHGFKTVFDFISVN